MKSLWGNIRYNIPDNIRIHGENLYAAHSIKYYGLPTYFFVFGVTQDDCFLSWDDVVEWCGLLDLQHVPIVYEGIWDDEKIRSLWPMNSEWSDDVEGYVVRIRDSFRIENFQNSVAKFVRKNHIQSDKTWFKGEWLTNKLKKIEFEKPFTPVPEYKNCQVCGDKVDVDGEYDGMCDECRKMIHREENFNDS